MIPFTHQRHNRGYCFTVGCLHHHGVVDCLMEPLDCPCFIRHVRPDCEDETEMDRCWKKVEWGDY